MRDDFNIKKIGYLNIKYGSKLLKKKSCSGLLKNESFYIFEIFCKRLSKISMSLVS